MSMPGDVPDYDWLEPWVLANTRDARITITVADGIDPSTFLERVGAQQPFQTVTGVPALSANKSRRGYGLLGVTQVTSTEGRDLILGIECPGSASYQAATELSKPSGTVLAVYYINVQDWFTWAEAGRQLAEFSWWIGMGDDMESAMGGDDLPEVANRVCQLRLGLDPYGHTDDPLRSAVALMTATFGAVITPALLSNADFLSGAVKVPR